MNKKFAERSVFVLAVLGSLVLINVIADFQFFRINRFPLSEATRETLNGLSDPVTIRAYFSQEDLPPQLMQITREVKDLLDDFYAAGKGNLRYEFIDPLSQESNEDKEKKKELKRDIFGRVMREKTSVEQELEQKGIVPLTIRVNEADKMEEKRVYLGLEISFGDKSEIIPALQEVENLEYELTTRIRKVSRLKAPQIALIVGHDNPDITKEIAQVYKLFNSLYEVTAIDLKEKDEIPDSMDTLVVIGPKTSLEEKELKAIDKFILSGKSAAFFLGPLTVSMENLQSTPIQHGLTGLMRGYGVEVEDALVLDAECATIGVTRQEGEFRMQQPVRYPFIPVPVSLKADHPLTRGMSRVSFPFTGPARPVEKLPEGVKAEVLVESSKNSWVMRDPYNLDPFQEWTREAVGELKPSPLAVTLSGAVPSAYGAGKAENARILIINGHAMLLDQFLNQSSQAFLLNLTDWLLLDEALLAIRSRGLQNSPIDPELTEATKQTVKYSNVLGLPIAFLALGLVRWRLRENRRKKVSL